MVPRSKMRRYMATDYTAPGAGVKLGIVRAWDADGAQYKANAKWPGKNIGIVSVGY